MQQQHCHNFAESLSSAGIVDLTEEADWCRRHLLGIAHSPLALVQRDYHRVLKKEKSTMSGVRATAQRNTHYDD